MIGWFSGISAYLYVGFDRSLADVSEHAVDRPPYARTLSGAVLMALLWPVAIGSITITVIKWKKLHHAFSIILTQILLVFIVYEIFHTEILLISNAALGIILGWILFLILIIPTHYVIKFTKEIVIGFLSGLLNSPRTFISGLFLFYGYPLRILSTWNSTISSSGELRHNRWNRHESRLDFSNLLKRPSPVENVRRAINKIIMTGSLCMAIPAWIGSYTTSVKSGTTNDEAVLEANRVVRFARYLRAGS